MSRAASIYTDLHLRSDSLRPEVASARRTLSGLSKQQEDDAKRLSAANRKLQTELGGLVRPAQAFLVATGAAVGLAVHEFASAERANMRLKSALAATGQEVNGNFEKFQAFAKGISAVTTLDDDAVHSLQELALNLGVAADQVNEVTKAGIGLGQRFFGGDYRRGVQAAALATEGQINQLRRMIPALQKVHSLQGGLNIINSAAAAGFKEAKADTESFSGSLAIMRREVGDAEKAIGSAFAPAIRSAAAYVRQIAQDIQNLTPEQKEQIVQWTKMGVVTAGATVGLNKVVGATSGLLTIFRAVAGASGTSTMAIAGTSAGLALLGAAVINLIGKGDTFAERFEDVWNRATQAVDKFTGGMVSHWNQVWDGIVLTFFKAQAAMFGGNADDLFKGYVEGVRQEQEKLRKEQEAQAKKQADANKKAASDEVNLQKQKGARMRGESKSSFMDSLEVYRSIQKAILDNATEAADKEVDIEKKKQKRKADVKAEGIQAKRDRGESETPAESAYLNKHKAQQAVIDEREKKRQAAKDKPPMGPTQLQDAAWRKRQADKADDMLNDPNLTLSEDRQERLKTQRAEGYDTERYGSKAEADLARQRARSNAAELDRLRRIRSQMVGPAEARKKQHEEIYDSAMKDYAAEHGGQGPDPHTEQFHEQQQKEDQADIDAAQAAYRKKEREELQQHELRSASQLRAHQAAIDKEHQEMDTPVDLTRAGEREALQRRYGTHGSSTSAFGNPPRIGDKEAVEELKKLNKKLERGTVGVVKE